MFDFTRDRLIHIGAFILALVGAIASYISGFELFKMLFSTDGQHLAATLYLIVLSILIIAAAIYREWQVGRKEKYANITEKLHNISHQVRDIETLMNEKKPDPASTTNEKDDYIFRCKDEFTKVLDEICGIFEMVTSTRCRVAIKNVARHKDGNYYVDTFTRDSNSLKRWGDLDNHRVETNCDLLDENKQFTKLFSADEFDWFFFCNNLARNSDFKTTSLLAYEPDGKHKVKQPGFIRRVLGDDWKLPYRSTITCAIRQKPCFGLKGKAEAVGFLAIDSESRGVFSKRWDVPLCFSFTDALFHPLDKILETMTEFETAQSQNQTQK